MLPTLRCALQLGHVIAQRLNKFDQLFVVLVRNCRCARHDPDVVARLAADNRLGVIVVEINNSIVCLDRPDETHTPERIGLVVQHEPLGVVLLDLAVKATFPERKVRGNRAVVIQAVGLNRVVRLFFEYAFLNFACTEN